VTAFNEPCRVCLRRSWLLAGVSGYIERARHGRGGRLRLLLALDDEQLLEAVGACDSAAAAAWQAFDQDAALARCDGTDVVVVCRHDHRYPAMLRDLPDAPAALFVAGGLASLATLIDSPAPVVAVVGARRATPDGMEAARALGRGLAAADVSVVSGMALGIDSAAHAGALESTGRTVAVLAAGADRAYPSSKSRLYGRIREAGCVVSELPPGSPTHKWCFPARNRIIAGLAALTVVVEAAERSGSLITAEFARDGGREVGAVPGRVASPLAAGTNSLLKDGAHVIRGAADALDIACGVGSWTTASRPLVPAHLAEIASAVGSGHETLDALVSDGHEIGPVLAGLAELELAGHVRRTAGGRYVSVTA